MSNDANELARLFKLWAKISMLVVEGKRGATNVADVLQQILEEINLPIWRRVRLGIYADAEAYRRVLAAKNRVINNWGHSTLTHAVFETGQLVDLDLVRVSVAKLGFRRDKTDYRDICAKAASLGLELCPAEVGPALRVQYDTQPDGEVLNIAMKPLRMSTGDRNIFCVANHEDVLTLGGDDGRPDTRWARDAQFVFVRPRTATK